jgi:hypothetical protein
LRRRCGGYVCGVVCADIWMNHRRAERLRGFNASARVIVDESCRCRRGVFERRFIDGGFASVQLRSENLERRRRGDR